MASVHRTGGHKKVARKALERGYRLLRSQCSYGYSLGLGRTRPGSCCNALYVYLYVPCECTLLRGRRQACLILVRRFSSEYAYLDERPLVWHASSFDIRVILQNIPQMSYINKHAPHSQSFLYSVRALLLLTMPDWDTIHTIWRTPNVNGSLPILKPFSPSEPLAHSARRGPSFPPECARILNQQKYIDSDYA